MEKLVSEIKELSASFIEDAEKRVNKGNASAGLRARKASLQLAKLLKEFRALSTK